MKMNARVSTPEILNPALKDRSLLENLDSRLARIGHDLAREADSFTGGAPAFRLTSAGSGYRLEAADSDSAWRQEYGTLRTAPRPWIARLVAHLRNRRMRLSLMSKR